MGENLPLWKLALLASPESFGSIPANFSQKNLQGAQGAEKSGYDPIKAAAYLRENYKTEKPYGQCAKYVRLAMEAGGGNTKGHPVSAKLYAATLKQVGYEKLDAIPKEYQIGDIMVFEPPYPKSDKIHGHIQMWDGTKWGSDFRQPANDFWPGPGYRKEKPKHEFFRYL
jgi:hypothetical protein